MNKNNYAIIMAGGVGSRFWPWSQTEKPKQFLDVLNTGKTLIQQTYERISKVCPNENILVITNRLYEDITSEQLPDIPKANILAEPQKRNTAPCIAYGAVKIREKNPQATILVAPADHIILKEELFIDIVKKGFEYTSENDVLITIGIKPHKPETGYGYIQSTGKIIDERENLWQMSVVSKFTEKPDPETAKQFVKSGDYFWNAGIFIWSGHSITRAFEEHMPDLYTRFYKHRKSLNTNKEEEVIKDIYEVCENISIDYGIMEKAGNVLVISTDIGWSDLGSWSTLQELSGSDEKGNSARSKKVLFYNSKGCLVKINDNKVGVIDGLENYIVVETDKALLICKKENEQNIKQFVQDVEAQFGKQYI